jgi:GNAT superfamily N-acetyltransferase
MAENPPPEIHYRVSPPITDQALNDLFAVSWPHYAWRAFEPVLSRSLVYLCAYHREQLVGFVNLAWDGGIHAFLLDTTVHPTVRRRGIGQQLVLEAARIAEGKGIQWLHVDYEPHLERFYLGCGFQPTRAALMRLFPDGSPGIQE